MSKVYYDSIEATADVYYWLNLEEVVLINAEVNNAANIKDYCLH